MTRSRVIAIVGAKGSPGCSFLAVGLARCLAASDIQTLVVDGDAEGGGLDAMLDAGPVTSTGRLAESARLGTLDAETVLDSAVQVEKRLWFAELGQADVRPFDGLELIGAARERNQAVVLDLGHRVAPLQRQLAAASDWLLWVVVPDRSGLARADIALASGALTGASGGLVFNRITRGSLEGAEEVLSSRHRLPVMARIHHDRRLADQIAKGRPFHRQGRRHRSLNQLARCVHPDARSAAPAWP